MVSWSKSEENRARSMSNVKSVGSQVENKYKMLISFVTDVCSVWAQMSPICGDGVRARVSLTTLYGYDASYIYMMAVREAQAPPDWSPTVTRCDLNSLYTDSFFSTILQDRRGHQVSEIWQSLTLVTQLISNGAEILNPNYQSLCSLPIFSAATF